MKAIGTITSIHKLQNSKMGNPRYKIRFVNVDGHHEHTTQTDAGWAYAIYDGWVGKRVQFEIQDSKQAIITDADLIGE